MLDSIFLGILQGLTEFLPISSSAHLRIAGLLMGENFDPGARFTAIIQIGTELAVLIYFRDDISLIIKGWARSLRRKARLSEVEKSDARLAWLIGLGSLPIVVFGYLFQDFIRDDLRSLWIVATTLIVFGLLLGILDFLAKSGRNLNQLTAGHGVLYGLAQALALIPGVSRSGATIAMGRALGYRRESALRYSFLLAIPAVLGSGLYELKDAISNPESEVFSLTETAVATVISFIVGYAVIAWLMKYVERKSFTPFVVYRIILGTTLLVLLSTGVIAA